MPEDCGAVPGKVVRLDCNMYGLEQAKKSWYKHLVTRRVSVLSKALRIPVFSD